MAIDRHPTGAVLRQLLRYDPSTGRLYWRERDERFCPSNMIDLWNKRWAGQEALTAACKKGYRRGRILTQQYLAHRVVWAMHYDEWPAQIDHFNRNPSDNRISNLRAVVQSENMHNRSKQKNNTTGVTGVQRLGPASKAKFGAKIKINGSTLWLGSFATLEEAAAARKAAEQKLGFHPNHGR